MDNILRPVSIPGEECAETPRGEASGALMRKKLLEMTARALAGEIAAARFYARLGELVIAPEDREIIRNVRLDEVKHQQYFQELLASLGGGWPGAYVLPEAGEETEPKGTLPAIFAGRVLEELQDAEYYTQLYAALSCLEQRDLVFEVIHDEERHAQLFNYLYSKYNR